MLEENNCFDAEVYADEIDVARPMGFREDQRSERHEILSHNCQIVYADDIAGS